MILCDTDILIDLDRDYTPAHAWAATLTEPLTLPEVTHLEALEARPNKVALARTLRLLGNTRTVWPEPIACAWAVDLMIQFNLSHGLKKYDALVAVTALAADAPLHTFNVKHFRFIPGLRTVQPYGRPAETGEE